MTTDLLDHIDRIIDGRSLLKHPFYQAWSKGSLQIESLKDYAAQYYHFELAYPTFLSGLHHRCTDQGLRQLLLENLWDEEHGKDNHVELWLRFCEALGLDRNVVRTGSPSATTQSLVNTYKHLTSEKSLSEGAAALYAYESQVPEVAKVKIGGLRDFYGMSDERSVSFFQVHQTLDEEHADAERKMVLQLALGKKGKEASIDAVDMATMELWKFLDGVYV